MKKFFLVIIAVTAAATLLFSQGLVYEPPQIEGFEHPFQSSFRSPLNEENPAILKNSSSFMIDTAIIDFEKRQLTFQRIDSLGHSIWTYHYGELRDYISDKKARSFYEMWHEQLTEERKQELRIPPTPTLEWELSVHYPPWAQRLLGNEPPRLRIEGRLQLTLAYDYTRTRTGNDVITDHIPVDFDPDYTFAIRGSVGRLISVNISHTKQDGFDLGDDPLKNFKVEYRESTPGELEDEIIQEIVVGYTGFDMPGTNLSGYSEKHDGLFGIKMRAKLGPLMLTAVASHAQGEAITKELGGRNDPNAMSALRETEFLRNRYFFLDTLYKDFYNRFNNIAQPDRNATRPPQVTGFQAFVSISNCNETAQSTERRYKADIDGNEACFIMLTENQDYTIDADRGWVRFERNIRDDDIIAIAMTTTSAGLRRGTMVPMNAPNDSRQELWMLKPRNMEELTSANSQNFGLMWRNVYHLSGIDDGRLDLFYLHPAIGDTIRHTSGSTLISRAMGLTDDQGRARLENVEIFNLAQQELIIPPWGPGRDGNEPFANPALGDMADASIYRMGMRTTTMSRDYVATFGIMTSGSTRRTSYDNLGWNILPGTVTVRTNSGTLLVEGEDYEIDYMMGIIDLLSTRARAAESITITYQRESDFVLERRVFAGLRGELKLPFISENSFMAGSVLYQNAVTSAEDVPQLGNEPFSKLHLSFNTSLDFQPEWMTKAVGLLPFIDAEDESAAKVDFEIVRSRMNTNTFRDRSAYLDDFERTKDAYSLSLRHTTWHPSHYPFPYTGGTSGIGPAMLESGRIPVWDFYWFTPNSHDDRHRINRFYVWQRDPNNPRHNTTNDQVDVLRMHATPGSREHPSDVRERFGKAYAAITTSFGRNGLNMENHQYLEMVVNPRGPSGVMGAGRRGRLMIQIGTFSHDQVRDGGPPNGVFDLEDPTYQNRPELLSQFDRGLNGRNVEDKFYMIPNAGRTGWDTLSRGQNTELLVFPRGVHNPSGDMFQRYDRDNLQNFRFANGTWGNNQYDSENIDGDGIPRININETFFSYVIDLDMDESPYIDPAARVMDNNGWRFYRIPLKDILDGISIQKDSANGGHDWSRVRGMRLVWYDFDEDFLTTENELLIAGLELVGNHWEPMPGQENKIEPTSISNYEDIDYYNAVHGFIVRPKAGEQTPEERSLRLRFFNMDDGETALVRKNMNHYPQNISGYDSISVMAFPVDNYGDGLIFVYRFGSDDSTYYEFSAPLSRGKEWNRFDFSLQDLSDLKLAFDVDGTPINASSGNLRVFSSSAKRPNFNTITYMAIGVTRGPGGPAEGEIWVNELMVTGARTMTGIAARLNVATQWSDFMSLALGAGYTHGDFRTMTDQPIKDSRSELFANLSGRIKADKFLPERWGVSIPIGGSVAGSLSRPTVKPQSDIFLMNDDGRPDGLTDMAGDALNMFLGREPTGETTRAQRFETFTTSRNAYTSFEKTSQSQNPLVGFTLDRIRTDVSYNMTASVTGRGPHEDNPDNPDYDYVRTDTTVTYAGNLRYDLSPRSPPSWTSLSLRGAEWVPQYYRYTFSLLPTTISFDLAEVQQRIEKRDDARLNVHNFTTRTFDMRHGMRIEYTPISPLLSFGYTTRLDRDLSDVMTKNDWDAVIDSTLPKIFGFNQDEGEKWDQYWLLYGERGRTQTASARFTPQFVSWMTHSVEYAANYTGQTARRDNDSALYLNTGVATAIRFRNPLLLNNFFKGLANSVSAWKPAADDDTTGGGRRTPEKGIFDRLSDGVSKINMRQINFEYDVMTDLKNSFLSSTYLADTLGMSNYDFFKYQLGMHRGLNDYMFGNLGHTGLGWMHHRPRTGVEHDLYRFDQSMGSWTARFSTSFNTPDPFRINFSNVSFGWGREFYAQPDTAFVDTAVVFPEVRASANTELLTRLSFIKRHMTRLAMTSSASYKHSRKETVDRTDTTVALEFQPLVSLDGRFQRWPSLSANYRYGRNNSRTTSGSKVGVAAVEAGELLSTQRTTRNTHALTAAYELTGAGRLQEIKIGNWVLPIQGKTNIGMTVNHEKTLTVTDKIGDASEEEEVHTDLNYSPFVDYRFTDNISARVRYLGSHRNLDGRRIMNQRFEIVAEVTF
ncbi:MAG: cell surface protein SprA [Chitinispirillales bacterium]|nr:cell surface protein SprA [Chitinispirillales bacterium]